MVLRRYLAEFLAAFFLVFAGVGAIVADQHLAVVQVRDSFGPLGVALAQGIGLAVAIAAFGKISGGHANPAISLAFFVTGRINAKELLSYIASQLLGGIAAAFLIKRLFLAQAVDQAGVGAPALQDGLSLFQGIAIEIILTFLLVTVFWAVAVDRRGAKSFAPLAIGLTLTMNFLVGGAFTGAAVNPARWLGPALAAGQFRSWPVWIVGPAVGALLAALLYESFFSTETSEPAQIPDKSRKLEPGEPASTGTAASSTQATTSETLSQSTGPPETQSPGPATASQGGSEAAPPPPPGPTSAPASQPPPPPPPPPHPGPQPETTPTLETPEQSPAPGPQSPPSDRN